ncbi:MAG: type II and III secretion system protein family protein, partial [Bryobacteraceae bacterium]
GVGGTIGRSTTGQFSAPAPDEIGSGESSFSLSDALNVFAFRPEFNIGAFIRALQQDGVLQILAEPNLVTTNGKEASFLVGGEFPVPVLQGSGVAGAVTIQFREFGIRLTFNPVLTEHGTIKLFVRPEVSTIDLANAVTISGFLIPALATRRMETNIELGQGQSFVIAGLIDDRIQDNFSKVPGLSSIPLLGALFKSRAERKNRTELVVIVTPEIARPLEAGEPHPQPVMPREFLRPFEPSGNNPNSSTLKPDQKGTDKHISAQAARGGSKGKKNSADLAAPRESVVREFVESAQAERRCTKGKKNSADLPAPRESVVREVLESPVSPSKTKSKG